MSSLNAYLRLSGGTYYGKSSVTQLVSSVLSFPIKIALAGGLRCREKDLLKRVSMLLPDRTAGKPSFGVPATSSDV